jgi:hypothetical protein
MARELIACLPAVIGPRVSGRCEIDFALLLRLIQDFSFLGVSP